jgi:hypothetical protein
MALEQENETPTVIIDLGRQTPKRVKKLRKGGGRLMTDVEAAIADLRERGVVAENAQPVVVIVREREEQPLKGLMALISK